LKQVQGYQIGTDALASMVNGALWVGPLKNVGVFKLFPTMQRRLQVGVAVLHPRSHFYSNYPLREQLQEFLAFCCRKSLVVDIFTGAINSSPKIRP
jgi:hypothetical protein